MKWVTREKARLDRIACPWLLRTFIDKEAEFLYVPKDQVMAVAQREGAIPFGTTGAELHHFEQGGQEFVRFDAIIRKCQLTDPRFSNSRRLSVSRMAARVTRPKRPDLRRRRPDST